MSGDPGVDPAVKFVLLADLGVLMVPPDYDPANRLRSFAAQYRNDFSGYNGNITDANFPNPTRVLNPGDRLSLRVFGPAVGTTFAECLTFLAAQNAVLLGAQGASLAWEQKRAELLKGYWHASMDAKKRLWKDAEGVHRTPWVGVNLDGDFRFGLGYVGPARSDSALFCFCDLLPV